MKLAFYSILMIVVAALFVLSCDKETADQQNPDVSGQIVKHTSCKEMLKSAAQFTPDSLSCINYSFDGENKLTVKHINAGFNCCPESLWCNISLKNDTIIFHEFEKSASCKCNCLYDLDMEVTGISTKKYFLKFVEPYCGEQEKLFFEIDLSEETEGLVCVTRKQYPWGIFTLIN